MGKTTKKLTDGHQIRHHSCDEEHFGRVTHFLCAEFCVYQLKKASSETLKAFIFKWRPQGDSNPCRRRERPVSWTGLDDGDT